MTHAIWAVIPAAGIGRRMQSVIPKQYLSLVGRPVLEHSIKTLLDNKNIRGLVIALQPGDGHWSQIVIESSKPVIITDGGSERADSVLHALQALGRHEDFDERDWVMVHDAVRPCLRQRDIDRLITEVDADNNGGLLALPVRDTMKRQQETATRVAETIDRDRLWHALTPQYFPADALHKALHGAMQAGQLITDESSAMELAGYSPRLVAGSEDNIKITRPDDLRLAALYLQAQQHTEHFSETEVNA